MAAFVVGQNWKMMEKHRKAIRSKQPELWGRMRRFLSEAHDVFFFEEKKGHSGIVRNSNIPSDFMSRLEIETVKKFNLTFREKTRFNKWTSKHSEKVRALLGDKKVLTACDLRNIMGIFATAGSIFTMDTVLMRCRKLGYTLPSGDMVDEEQ